MTDGYSAGFQRMQIWLVDDNGFATGIDSSLANGSVSGAYLITDPQTAALAYADPTNLDIQGGDKIVATFQFGAAKLSPFTISLANIDPTLIALLTGSKVDNTQNAEYEMFSPNPANADPITVGMALTQKFQPKNTGTDGPDKYHTLIIPRAKVRVSLGQFQFQAEAPVTLNVTPNYTDTAPNGQAFGEDTNELDLGLTDDETDHYSMITAKPVHVATYKGLNTDTDFTLPYKPLSSVVTVTDSPNFMAIEGVPTAPSSVTPATGVVAISTPTDGNRYVMIYQTAFKPSA